MISARTLTLVGILGLSALGLFGCDPEKAAGGTTGDAPAVEQPKEEPNPAPVDVSSLPMTPADGEEVGVFETSEGKVVFMFYPQIAPKHVERFKAMIKEGFYDGTRFHRCIAGFMVQGGDPQSKDLDKAPLWGTGGYTDSSGKEVQIPQEFNTLHHARGVMSTARSNDPNSGSSQFFMMHQNNPSLDGQYTAWGRIVQGIEVVDKIVVTGDAANNGAVAPNNAVILKKATIQTWPVK